MQRISNKKIAFFFLISTGFFWASAVKAVCPICVVAVGAGLGLSRWFGVDDVISSIWIGGLLVAVVLWTLIWLKKKKWDFAYSPVLVTLAYYLLTFVPLYYAGILGHPLNTIWGTDKIIFGVTVGSIIFLLSNALNNYLKHKNNGKPYFSYQKVVLPVIILILTSSVFYAALKWWTL